MCWDNIIQIVDNQSNLFSAFIFSALWFSSIHSFASHCGHSICLLFTSWIYQIKICDRAETIIWRSHSSDFLFPFRILVSLFLQIPSFFALSRISSQSEVSPNQLPLSPSKSRISSSPVCLSVSLGHLPTELRSCSQWEHFPL